MLQSANKKPFHQRIKDTGYLVKHSFTVIGKDKDIKTPLINIIILRSVISTLLFISVLFLILGIVPSLALFLIFASIGLGIFNIFYKINQKANQSWIVYNTIIGKDISYADSKEHINKHKKQLQLLGLIDLLMGFVKSKKSEDKKGLGPIIMSFLAAALLEVWDLAQNYSIPAVVIEQKSIKELLPTFKSLKSNVPGTLVGVFGIDFVGNIAGTILRFARFILVGLGIVISIAISSWIPIITMLYISILLGGGLKVFVESIKTIYFTIFYTSINRPKEIVPGMREELTHYLLLEEDKKNK